MGREIRMVPLGWNPPDGPHFDSTYESAMADWQRDPDDMSEPDPDYYRPAWPADAVMGYMVYENVTEGTPISPIFETREALIEWLTQPEGAPGMGIGGRTLVIPREAAERFVDAKYAPSFVSIVSDTQSTILPGVVA